MENTPVIKILNWDKYNPRLDTKKPSWFRLDNTLATGIDLFELDSDQKWFFIFLMSMASQANNPEVPFNMKYFVVHSGVSKQKINSALSFLEQKGIVGVSRKVTSRPSQGNPARAEGIPSATDGRTDERTYMEDAGASTEQDTPKRKMLKNSKDLDPLRNAIYDAYPRRGAGQNMNKGVGMKRLSKVSSKEKLEKMKQASENYAKAQNENGNAGTKFTMQFSTFVNGRWEEWLDVEKEKQKKKPRFGGEKCTGKEESIL